MHRTAVTAFPKALQRCELKAAGQRALFRTNRHLPEQSVSFIRPTLPRVGATKWWDFILRRQGPVYANGVHVETAPVTAGKNAFAHL